MAEAENLLNAEAGVRKRPKILVYAGALFLSYLITCVVIYFIMKRKYEQAYPPGGAAVDSTLVAAADTTDTARIRLADTTAAAVGETLTVTALVPAAAETVSVAAPAAVRPDTVRDTTLITAGYPMTAADSALAEEQQRRVTRLVRIVDKMSAADAASILSKLDDEFVLQILMRMKERNAAKVLTEMPASRAAKLSAMISSKTPG